ncbi:MAG: AMP-binding protein [Acidimicrobiales bacterium]
MTARSFNLADLFEGAAEAIADTDAVVTGGAGVPTRRLTYAELDRRANRVANHLQQWGIGPGDHVGVHLFNGAEFLEATLAAFKLRAVPVNANFRYTAAEIAYVFDDAEVKAVITDQTLVDRVARAVPDLPRLAVCDDYEAAVGAASEDPPAVGARSGDDLYLLYTGGTTGHPKGVMWRHEDLFFGALGGQGAPRQGLAPLDDPDDIGRFVRTGTGVDRRLPLCPLIHGGAQWAALTALLIGGTCLLSVDRRFDAASALRFAAAERAQFIMIIGDAVGRPLADELTRSGDQYDLSDLQLISSSGAILSPAVKGALESSLPGVRVSDRFGASETGGQGRIKRNPDGSGPLQLVGDSTTVVIDDEGAPVQPGSGITGKLARRGWIPLGYWNDAAKTAETFPVIDGVRYSVPGDLATVEADGTVTVFGRGSGVINTGGEKVFPEEVEATIKAHPAVFDALVVGVPDERFGQQVAAVVSVRDGHRPPSVDELDSRCRDDLAGYKVPRRIVFVDDVQRKVTGKPDYAWARAAAEGGEVTTS